MSDTPKFTVVDRRKFRAEDDSSTSTETVTEAAAPEAAPKTTSAPRLTLVEPHTVQEAHIESPVALAEELEGEELTEESGNLPPAPTAEETSFQKTAYEAAADRLDDLVRAQNPAIPKPEKIGFEHLVQQLYLSAMMQMGAGTPEGQRPRIDILGARQTIDLLQVVLDKGTGNLSAMEERTLQTVLFEVRMTFLELTRMISAQAQAPLPPPPGAGPGSGLGPGPGFGSKR
jgi:hypothetical protein